MTATIGAVKETAKKILKGNFAVSAAVAAITVCAILICILAVGLLTTVFGNIIAVAINLLLELFIIYPLLLGVLRFFRRMQWGVVDRPSAVFHYFSQKQQYKRALLLIGGIFIKVLSLEILIYLPFVASYLLTSSNFYRLFGIAMPAWAAQLGAVPIILKGISAVVVFFVTLRYYLAPFLFVADEKMDPAEAILTSQTISRRTVYDFLGLLLTLAPFILLCFLFIPIVFFLPYLIACYLVHCRYAVADYNSLLKSLENRTEYFSV